MTSNLGFYTYFMDQVWKWNVPSIKGGGIESIQETREQNDREGRSAMADLEVDQSRLELQECCLQEEKTEKIFNVFQCLVYL